MKLKISKILALVNDITTMQSNQEARIKENPEYPRFPLRVSYNLNKNKTALQLELESYYTSLKELIEQYDIKIDDAGSVVLPTETDTVYVEQFTKFSDAVNELQAIEVDVAISTIKLEDFKDYNPSEIEMLVLFFMIAEAEEE